MRPLFAAAAIALAAASSGALAFDRYEIAPGDTVTGDLTLAGTFDELDLPLARGSQLTLSIGRAGGGNYRPAIGLYDDDYRQLPLLAIGPTTVRSLPLNSGQHRILVGSQGTTVGGWRVRTSVKPAKRFALAATQASPADTLTFGAYPGFTFSVSIAWKGPAPVTIASLAGPDGAALASAQDPRVTARSFSQAGFTATSLGDHVLTLDVPEGTSRWSASVRLAGKLPRGTSQDHRSEEPPQPPGIAFPSVGRAPLVQIVGEWGGPNEALLSATAAQGATGVPDATFYDGGAGTGGCSRAPRGTSSPPDRYLLFCADGFFADVTGVERDAQGHVTRFDAPSIRTPQGSGSATFSGFAYDAQGRPTGWTEVRRYDASGRSHELVVSRAEYFSGNGLCKAFRVAHRVLPGGVSRTYDFAPIR